MKNFLLSIICFHLLINASVAQLGSAASFTLFTVSGAVGNTGASSIAGNIGTNAGAVTGFDASMSSKTYVANTVTAQCAADVQNAFNELFYTTATSSAHAPAFGSGETLHPGVYAINSAGSVAGNLTLDGQGNQDAVFIFQINGAFSTAAATTIILTNGAKACNTFWVAEGAIAMGASTTMRGTLIANNGAISMAAGGVLEGRMFSTTGAVAVDAVHAELPVCTTTPGTFNISSGATVKTTGNVFMVLNSMNIVNNGSILQATGEGTTILTGNSNTTVSGTGTTTLENLEVAIPNGFTHTLGATVGIKKAITLTSGQYISNGYLVIKSDSLYTARVAPVTSTASPAIAGTVVVERYIPGRRKYRLMTSSVTSSALPALTAGQEALSIWGNWQNNGVNIANKGTLITGGTSADGFDQQTPSASVYCYDAANRKFVAISTALGKNTKYTPLKAGVAYYMFVYGDRTNTISTSSPKSTVITERGTLLIGDQTYNTSSSTPLTDVVGRYTLLGNPYAAPIDWSAVTKSNIADTYWGWDPNLSSTGGYVTVTTVGNTSIVSPLTGTTALNKFIQPGQGFFVKTTGSSPSLTIKEEHKTTSIIKKAFRGTEDDVLRIMAVNLQYKSGTSTVIADGALAIFDATSGNQSENEDVVKMVGNAENVSVLSGNDLLSVDVRQMPANNDTIFLNVAKLTKPQYTLQIFTTNLQGSVMPYLEDTYLNTSQLLSLTDTNFVVINITSDAASFDAKRFRIVFQELRVLPVQFVSIQAGKTDKDVLVEWKVASEAGILKYEIEHSTNGINFSKRGELAVQTSQLNTTYHWTDKKPDHNNYYRIRAVQADSKFYFSNVVAVKMDPVKPVVHIFPNPIEHGNIHITMSEMESGKYAISLLNLKGQVVYKTSIQHKINIENHLISLNAKIAFGTYIMNICSMGQNKISFNEILIIK